MPTVLRFVYLAGDAWNGGDTARKSISSEVALNGFQQLIVSAIVRVVSISLLPPFWTVESCSTITTFFLVTRMALKQWRLQGEARGPWPLVWNWPLLVPPFELRSSR